MARTPLAAIVGIAGETLHEAEAALMRARPPLGVILFARNVAAPDQLASLVMALRAALPERSLLLVDQEGGRVARLRPPHWRRHPPAAALGALHAHDAAAGLRAAWLTGALIGGECAGAGFDVACAPVLDRAVADAHDVIGDRAFAAEPPAIAALAHAFAEGLLAAGVQPVGKHVPGHGRAGVDSHLSLPELARIEAADLAPFAALAWLPWMMTAHIRYRGDDPLLPATLSPAILGGVVRGRLGFENLLISDDLAMQALSGTPGSRAAAAVAAGCDVALHCSGRIEDSADVLERVPTLGAATLARLERARDLAASRRRPLDLDALYDERERLIC